MDTHFELPNLGRAINLSASLDDNSFGPFIEFPGKVTFDFTLLFEETILSILPSALFLLLIPPRILRLWGTPRKVTGSSLQTIKIVGSKNSPCSVMLTLLRHFLPFSASCKSSISLKCLNHRSAHAHPSRPLCLHFRRRSV